MLAKTTSSMNIKVKDVRVLGSISEKMPMGSSLQRFVLDNLIIYLIICCFVFHWQCR